MTVTFTTPPGSTLASRFAPVLFTATQEVIALSVSIGSVAAEERAFRDGAFVYPYLNSTRNGSAYSLARSGGWVDQRAPLVFVDENQTPSSGQTLAPIYQVDLTAQPNLTMTAAGSYTIDGKTWWAKRALVSGSCVCAVVNGSGLQLSMPDGDWDGATWQPSNATFASRMLAFPIAQLADYNASAPLVVEWRITSSKTLSANNSAQTRVWGGLGTVVLSSAAFTAAEKGSMVALSRTQNSAAIWDPDPRVNSTVNPVPAGSSDVVGNWVQGVYRFCSRKYYPLLGAYAGSLGNPEDYQAFNTAVVPAWSGNSITDAAPSFTFNMAKPTTGAGTGSSFFLTHLKIMQPKVTA